MAVATLSLALSTEANAAETFVLFEPAADTWQLSNPTISLAESEHSCVKIAAASLKADFGKVTGTEATITSLTSQLSPLTSKSILIGTVGVNKQIEVHHQDHRQPAGHRRQRQARHRLRHLRAVAPNWCLTLVLLG